ncbi:MAG TPA: hypothetical protein VFC16_17445 [Nakamurella sp.]|nr:hypothetical protein [Nakamurella sp.]
MREHPSGSIDVTPVDGGDIRIVAAWLQDIQRKGLSLDDSDQAAPVENRQHPHPALGHRQSGAPARRARR